MKFLRHVGERRNPVIDQIRVDQLTIVVNELLEKRMSNPLHRRALFLGNAVVGMDRLANIGDGDKFFELHFASLMIDLDLRSAHADFPENRQLVVRDLRSGFAAPDHFAARALTETALEGFLESQPGFAADQGAVGDLNLARFYTHRLRANFYKLLLHVACRFLHRRSHQCRRAARSGRAVVRRHLGIGAEHAKTLHRQGQLFCGDLG